MATQLPIPSQPPSLPNRPVGKRKFEAETLEGLARTKRVARFFRDLPGGKLTSEQAAVAERDFGIPRATLYRYKREFKESPRISSLLDRSNRKRQRANRYTDEIEASIAKTTRAYWKANPEGDFVNLLVEVNKKLRPLGAQVSISTVRRRFKALSQSDRHAIRYNAKDARAKFDTLKGHTPEQIYPLARVQVDSTMCDVWLINPDTGVPIGRAWVTFVLDECTRCILGFFVTFEAPSSASVALALHHAVLPKEDWLAERGVQGEWPCSGIMNALYTDNGSEFRAAAYKAGCDEWLIDYSYRPVARPRWGGQIERVIGTFMKQMRLLPGAVVKKTEIADRRGYDPKKHAVLTISELERHLAMMVIAYHNKKHSALAMTPLQKWKAASREASCDMAAPVRQVDVPTKFLIDFLPLFTPTYQRYGFRIGGLEYSDENLCYFDDIDISTEVIARRNPHDISKIYVYHPSKRFYVEVRCANADAPKTVWELQRAKDFNKANELESSPDALARAAAILQLQENLDLQRKKQRSRAHRNNARSAASERLVIPVDAPSAVVEATVPALEPKVPFIPRSISVEMFK
jgi:putative transposase